MPAYRVTTDVTWSQTKEDLAVCFRKWAVRTWAIEPNPRNAREAVKLSKRDGAAVTVTFTLRGKDVRLTSSKQARGVDNFRVVYLALERMRLIEAAGVEDLVREVYAQLPPPGLPGPAAEAPETPWAILGVPVGTPLANCEAAYRRLAKELHPDAGGNAAAFARLSEAIAKIRNGS